MRAKQLRIKSYAYVAKSAKKRASARTHWLTATAKPPLTSKTLKATGPLAAASVPHDPSTKSTNGGVASKSNGSSPSTKQSRVLAMLRSPAGATIAAIMRATGWQQHSVRGFLTGVVRKRLKLELISRRVDGRRVYQIGSDRSAEANSRISVEPVSVSWETGILLQRHWRQKRTRDARTLS